MHLVFNTLTTLTENTGGDLDGENPVTAVPARRVILSLNGIVAFATMKNA